MPTASNNSFAPPNSALADIAAQGADSEKASRGARLGASMLDGLILVAPFAPSYFIALPRILSAGKTVGASKVRGVYGIWSSLAATGAWFYLGAAVSVVLLAITTVLVHRNGQTIGKKLLGIKVVRSDGSRATLGRIFWVRYCANALFSLVPLVGSLYSIVDLLFIFGAAKRCCHDYLADTIVVEA